VVRSPAELDDAEAVSLLVNYNTMYFALAHRAALRPGDTVLVLGASGGVGTAAVQIAKAMGASKVIAVVHREEAVDYVRSLGADVVFPQTDGWAERVRKQTDGQGVDIVVDPVGGDAFDDAIGAMAIDGMLLVIGFASGGIPTLKVNRLLLRNVSVGGRRVGRVPQQGPRFGRPVFLRPEPTGPLGPETASAATLSVVGSPGRAAEPGRRRGTRQGCPRAVALASGNPGDSPQEDFEFEAARQRQQCGVGSYRSAERIDQPTGGVTVDHLLYPGKE